MEFAIVDIETTGLAGDANRVTEIALVVHNGEEELETFHTLVNPEVPISSFVTGLTGIDDTMVSDAPLFEDLAEHLLQLMKDRVFVAHNVQFDYQVLRREFRRCGHDFTRQKLCTVRWSRKVYPGLRSYSLGKLCSSLGIPLNNRHRAFGDTEATVKLFRLLLENDSEDHYKTLISGRSGMAALPSLLPREEFDALPDTPGVYYFKNNKGEVIYVGKAIRIKKRVLGHFYDKKPREIALCRETAHIDFTPTGSELLALLLESAEIKKYYPKFNRAQKKATKGYYLTTYTDRKGIVHLGYAPAKHTIKPLRWYPNPTACKAALEDLCIAYELCPKYTQLQSVSGSCDHYKVKNCKGVCRDAENVEAYNKRALQAVEEISLSNDTFALLLPGREEDENGLVLIEEGIYMGYGFLSKEEQITGFEQFFTYIERREHNGEVLRIIQQQLTGLSDSAILYPTEDEILNGRRQRNNSENGFGEGLFMNG